MPSRLRMMLKVQMIDTSMMRVHQHGAGITDAASQSVSAVRGVAIGKLQMVVEATPNAGEARQPAELVLLPGLKPQTMLLADGRMMPTRQGAH
jgi:hypothetical protein